MKKWVMVLCAWMLMLCAACAQANEWGTLFEPPQEVLEHIQSRWADYELEDYCEVQGTSKGDYGFALLHKQSERILVGYHRVSGEMKYWLKNAGAVPQGKEKASFYVGEAGWKDELDQYENPTGKKVYDDGLYFGLHMLDEIGESYQYGVAYRWQDGMFRLFAYYKGAMDSVTVTDDGLNFFEYANGEQGYVKGKVQRDIRYVSFNALPTWIDDAKTKLTVAPNLKDGAFTAQKVKFTGGQKYPVYTGPGEDYVRSGNGKGLVSTNGWIEVYGQKDGYILIQYSIDSSHYRFGWIDRNALPEGTSVPAMDFAGISADTLSEITQDTFLTDDPLFSQKKLCSLKAGQTVSWLAVLNNDWAYVLVNVNGKMMCGFVRTDCIVNG